MDLYIIKSSDFVKIGVSENFENRKLAYSNILDSKVFYNLDNNLAILIESLTVNKFSSDTEYIYGGIFEEILFFVESKLQIKINDFYFNPLELNINTNSEGYYDMSKIIDYCNEIRQEKGKNKIFIADYLKTKKAKDFISLLESKYNKKPLIAKVGKYGGSYAIPEIVLDFLFESDVSIKFKVMDWAYKNQLEYKYFKDIATQNTLNLK